MTTFYVLMLFAGAYGVTPMMFPERFTTEAACRAVGERWAFPADYDFQRTRIDPTFKCIKMKKAVH